MTLLPETPVALAFNKRISEGVVAASASVSPTSVARPLSSSLFVPLKRKNVCDEIISTFWTLVLTATVKDESHTPSEHTTISKPPLDSRVGPGTVNARLLKTATPSASATVERALTSFLEPRRIYLSGGVASFDLPRIATARAPGIPFPLASTTFTRKGDDSGSPSITSVSMLAAFKV